MFDYVTDYVMRRIAVYGYVLLYIAMHGYVITIYRYVYLCLAIFGYEGLCIAIHRLFHGYAAYAIRLAMNGYVGFSHLHSILFSNIQAPVYPPSSSKRSAAFKLCFP